MNGGSNPITPCFQESASVSMCLKIGPKSAETRSRRGISEATGLGAALALLPGMKRLLWILGMLGIGLIGCGKPGEGKAKFDVSVVAVLPGWLKGDPDRYAQLFLPAGQAVLELRTRSGFVFKEALPLGQGLSLPPIGVEVPLGESDFLTAHLALWGYALNKRAEAPVPVLSGRSQVRLPKVPKALAIKIPLRRVPGLSQYAPADLIPLNGFEQRPEIAFAKSIVAFAFDDFVEEGTHHVLGENLQQIPLGIPIDLNARFFEFAQVFFDIDAL